MRVYQQGQIEEFPNVELSGFLHKVVRGRSEHMRNRALTPTHVIFGQKQRYTWEAWIAWQQLEGRTRPMIRPEAKHECFGLTVLYSPNEDLLEYATIAK